LFFERFNRTLFCDRFVFSSQLSDCKNPCGLKQPQGFFEGANPHAASKALRRFFIFQSFFAVWQELQKSRAPCYRRLATDLFSEQTAFHGALTL